MEVSFLGTSAGWPLPRLGCDCPICTSNDPKDKRSRPSILINRSVLIDAGPDFYQQISEVPPGQVPEVRSTIETPRMVGRAKDITTIFISHNHPDHYFGLWDVAKIYGKKPTVFLSAKNKKILSERLNDATINSVLQQAEIFSHNKEIQLDQLVKSNKNLSITPFLVDHSTNTETFGFLVKETLKQSPSSEVTRGTKYLEAPRMVGRSKEKQKTFIYIPDFRSIPQNSLKYLKKADLAILDGSNFLPAGPARWGHMPMMESIKLAKKLKIKKVYFTHIGHGPKMGTHKQLEEKVRKIGGKNFHLAWDGLKLEI